jgi:hypothetical protein
MRLYEIVKGVGASCTQLSRQNAYGYATLELSAVLF